MVSGVTLVIIESDKCQIFYLESKVGSGMADVLLGLACRRMRIVAGAQQAATVVRLRMLVKHGLSIEQCRVCTQVRCTYKKQTLNSDVKKVGLMAQDSLRTCSQHWETDTNKLYE